MNKKPKTDNRKPITVLGLTGGIASGKSFVSDILKKHDFPLIDADQIAKQITKNNSKVYKKILSEFGTTDNQKLGKIVFKDKDKRKKLEEITHPEILKKINEKIGILKQKGHKNVIIDVPLLIESGFYKNVDIVVLVYVDLNTQISRLMKRDGISKDFALKKINSQMPLDEKKNFADFVVDNSGNFEDTKNQVEKIIKDF